MQRILRRMMQTRTETLNNAKQRFDNHPSLRTSTQQHCLPNNTFFRCRFLKLACSKFHKSRPSDGGLSEIRHVLYELHILLPLFLFDRVPLVFEIQGGVHTLTFSFCLPASPLSVCFIQIPCKKTHFQGETSKATQTVGEREGNRPT